MQHTNKLFIFFATFLLNLFHQTAFAGAGNLDSTFGSGGNVQLSKVESMDVAYISGTGLQSDSKIIVSANVYAPDTPNQYFVAIVRLNQNGTIDPTFGNQGSLFISNIPLRGGTLFVGKDDSIFALASPDSGIPLIFKINKNGVINTSWGTNGVEDLQSTLQSIVPYSFCVIQNIKTDSEGKLIVAGMYNYYAPFIARLNTNGQLDSSFGDRTTNPQDKTGWTTSVNYGLTGTAPVSSIFDFDFTTDGKIVVLGKTSGDLGGLYNAFNQSWVSRLNTDGSDDETFASNGIFSPAQINDRSARTAKVLSDGSIIVAGTLGLPINQIDPLPGISVWKLHPNGDLDTTFGNSGEAFIAQTIDPKDGTPDTHNLGISTDGRILLAGTFNAKAALIRFTTSGQLDNSYGTKGISYAVNGLYIDPMILQSNDKAISVNGTTISRTTSGGALSTLLIGLIPLCARRRLNRRI